MCVLLCPKEFHSGHACSVSCSAPKTMFYLLLYSNNSTSSLCLSRFLSKNTSSANMACLRHSVKLYSTSFHIHNSRALLLHLSPCSVQNSRHNNPCSLPATLWHRYMSQKSRRVCIYTTTAKIIWHPIMSGEAFLNRIST